jgi:hypothetical protein
MLCEHLVSQEEAGITHFLQVSEQGCALLSKPFRCPGFKDKRRVIAFRDRSRRPLQDVEFGAFDIDLDQAGRPGNATLSSLVMLTSDEPSPNAMLCCLFWQSEKPKPPILDDLP